MAPRKGKVQKEEQVISLGPQVISQAQLHSILYNDKQLFLRNCLLSFGKFEIAMGRAGHNCFSWKWLAWTTKQKIIHT